MSNDIRNKQKFEERFCLFHRGLIAVGVVEDSCQACIKNSLFRRGLSIFDPENVTLYPAGNLGILIRIIGVERWHTIRENPVEIRRMIETLDFFEQVKPGSTSCESDEDLPCTV